MINQAWPVVQVYLNQQDVAVANYTAEELQENASDQSNGQFDFNEVRNVSATEVNQVRTDIEWAKQTWMSWGSSYSGCQFKYRSH